MGVLRSLRLEGRRWGVLSRKAVETLHIRRTRPPIFEETAHPPCLPTVLRTMHRLRRSQMGGVLLFSGPEIEDEVVLPIPRVLRRWWNIWKMKGASKKGERSSNKEKGSSGVDGFSFFGPKQCV